ncbi:MAG: hypothetical protein ACYCS1_07910 [Gammaproteobacteria bacterium]
MFNSILKHFRSFTPARRAGAAAAIGLAAALLYTHPWHQARRPAPLSPAARLASRAREKKEGLPRILWTSRTPPRAPEAEAQALQEELWSGIFIFLLAGATAGLVLEILWLALAGAAGRNDDEGAPCSRSQS